MDKKQALELAKKLLEEAKKSPSKLIKKEEAKCEPEKMKKDDMPHPAGSPEDKAHDVAEEDESIKQALALLDTPEKRSKMLEHLRTLSDESELRSPENQEVGKDPMEKSQRMTKAQIKEDLKKEWKPKFKKGCK